MTDNITPDQARELLQKEKQARVDAAKVKLDAFLAEWQAEFRVRLRPVMLVSEDGNLPQWLIVPED